MMLLAQAITQHFLTLTRNHLHTSSNTRNQAFIQDGSVDIQSKNVRYVGNGSKNFERVRDSKFFKELMLLAKKDKVVINLDDKENDFMLKNSFSDELLKELNASVIMMACIQPVDNYYDVEPTFDSDFVCE
nr:hypothetical protein [Tanacetum cinerariifolium]